MTCIIIDTPQSIKDEGNDYYAENTDIFAKIFETADMPLSHAQLMQTALWAYYRYRMIGNCNTPEWVQAMADRLTLKGAQWDAIIDRSLSEDLTDLHELYYNRIIRHESIEGTSGDVTTQTGSGQDVNVVEDEDLPQTPIGTSDRYLSRRSTQTSTPASVRTSTYAPNTKDSETYSEDRNIMARTFSDMMSNYPDVLGGFCAEFSGYFLPVIG